MQSILQLVLIGGGIHAILWLISDPPTLFSDFQKAYYPAAELLWLHGRAAPWPFTEVGAGGFVNLPVFAWLFTPLVALGDEAAAWAFLVIGVAAVLAAWVLLVRLGTPPPAPGISMPLAWLFLINGPLVNSLREGNTTHFILLLLVIALILLQRGAHFSAGLLLGLCALIKLPLLLFGPYFLLRRRWGVVAGGIASILAAGLLSILVFGLESNVQWWNICVVPFLGRAIPAFNVQSIDGFLVRLHTGPESLVDWTPHALLFSHTLARTVILAAMLGTFLWIVLLRPNGRKENGGPAPAALEGRDLMEFAMVPVLAIVTSPVSWSHYYLLLLLPWGLWLGGRLPMPRDTVTQWLMCGSVVLCSLPVVNFDLHPDWIGALLSRTFVSAWLFGGLLLLAAMFRAVWLATPSPLGIERFQSEPGVEQQP